MTPVVTNKHNLQPTFEHRSTSKAKRFIQSASDAIYRHGNDISLSLLALGFDVALGGMSATIANTAALFFSRIVLPFSLLAAVKVKSEPVISSLLRIGVDPDAGFRTTSLIHACEIGDKLLVQRLIAANVDVNRKRRMGFLGSPLHAAVNHPEIVQLLIDAGAHVTAVDKFGLTPLHYAAHYQLKETARVLIRAGANPFIPLNIESTVSSSPFWLARNDLEMIRILMEIEGMDSFKYCNNLNEVMNVYFPRVIDLDEAAVPVHLVPTIEAVPPFVEEGEVRFDPELLKVAMINPSIENILALMKSHSLFSQVWPMINQLQELKIRFIPGLLKSSNTGACYQPDLHEIRIDEELSPQHKISTFIFESMNAVQRASPQKLYELAAMGKIDRETYAILMERIEYNSLKWAVRIRQSMGEVPSVPSFAIHWKNLSDSFSFSNNGHTERIRNEWDNLVATNYFLANPYFLQKRNKELLAKEKAQQEEFAQWRSGIEMLLAQQSAQVEETEKVGESPQDEEANMATLDEIVEILKSE